METSRKTLGNLGEEMACGYMTAHGHTIIDRNWRYGHLEVDIISTDRQGLHFVEVKSRVAPVSAAPEDNVTLRKQQRLVRAAQAYLHEHCFGDLEVTFDVVSVVFDGASTQIEYYNQAFIPIYI